MSFSLPSYVSPLRQWTGVHFTVAALAGIATYFLLGVPTDVVNNRVFGRSIESTPWSMPVLIATAILSGLLAATYVGVSVFDSTAKMGTIGGALSFFAIGCPVCNKLVLIALGTTGAINYFGPIQPYLAFAGLLLLTWAFMRRLKNAGSCALSPIVPHNTPTSEGENSCVQQ
ncbi:unannotated protein [freshwater metagenome]|uniref:Unannotated protein n=1 Tax=freshwater metagenome TaxID=449393 RepID=A0A6J6JYP9_9ZZZZ